MTGSAFRAVAPVSAVCAAFAAQSSAYPPSTKKPDVAPTCGRMGNSTEVQRSGFGRKRKCGNRGKHRDGQNRGILDAAARKQDKRMASKPTLFLFTTARSADCIKGLRRRCDWRLFGEK